MAVAIGDNSRWSVVQLQESDARRVFDYLNQDPLLNVYLISRLRDDGIVSNNTTEVRLGDRTICLATLGSNIVLASHPPRLASELDPAMALLAERITARGTPVRAIVSESELVESLWVHLGSRVDPPTVLRLNQPIYALLQKSASHRDLATVRYSTLEDLEDLVPACAAMHREEVGIDPLERDAFGYRERIRDLVLSGRSLILRSDGRIAFKCELSAVTPMAVQLMGVWTHPAMRRRGLAMQGLREVCGHLLQQGRKVTLFVNDFNAPAITLYRALGFEQIGTNRALIW